MDVRKSKSSVSNFWVNSVSGHLLFHLLLSTSSLLTFTAKLPNIEDVNFTDLGKIRVHTAAIYKNIQKESIID